MDLRLLSLTCKMNIYPQFCGNEEYNLKINMDTRGYTKEPSDDVIVYS